MQRSGCFSIDRKQSSNPGWDARCPEFDTFLHEILDDAEKERLVKSWLGYCLTGRVDFQKIML